MNVLIVEDETITRMGLKKIIQDQEGFTLAGECSNGKQALETIKRQPNIDVVLLDLNMPIMDGLQFLSHLDSSFQGKIVVLSSYDDLDNIKEAMKRGACDYFHKPTMSPKKIIKMLQDIYHNNQKKNNNPVEEWLKELIHCPSDHLIKNSYHWIASRQNDLFAVIISINDCSKTSPPDHEIKKSMNQWKKENDFTGEIVFWKEGQYLLIGKMNSKSGLKSYSLISKLCFSLGKFLNKSLDISVSCGISQVGHQPLNLKEAVKQAELALKEEFFSGRGSILFNNIINEKLDLIKDKPSDTEVWESFNKLDLPSVDNALDEYFNQLIGLHDKNTIRSLCIELLLELKRRTEQYLSSQKPLEVSTEQILFMGYFTDLEKYVKNVFQSSVELINTFHNKKYSPIIRKVLEYVHVHFAKEISLNHLADLVQTNPSYLSRIFKEQTNVNISDYITKLRIEKAKKLLANQMLRTKEVALSTGYMNERYFSQIFKRETGMTPTEFKKQT